MFVTKVNEQGSLVFTQVKISDQSAFGQGIAADSDGHIFIAGNTDSIQFTVHGPVQGPFSFQPGFLMELDDWGQPLFSTFVGDTHPFQVAGLTLDPSGMPLFCGNTIAGPQAVPSGVWAAKYDTTGLPTGVRLDALYNLAGQEPVPVSPGEIVTINGAGLGTDTQLYQDPRAGLESRSGEARSSPAGASLG